MRHGTRTCACCKGCLLTRKRPSPGERDFTRLDELVDRALLQDLQRSQGPYALVGSRTSSCLCVDGTPA